MGTNFYARQKVTKHQIFDILLDCDDFFTEIINLIFREQLHIGKNCSGWTFSFQAYEKLYLTTYGRWLGYLKSDNIDIIDEYGNNYTISEFEEMVEELQNPKLNLKNHAKECKGMYPKQYFNDSLGYSFTIPEFS